MTIAVLLCNKEIRTFDFVILSLVNLKQWDRSNDITTANIHYYNETLKYLKQSNIQRSKYLQQSQIQDNTLLQRLRYLQQKL